MGIAQRSVIPSSNRKVGAASCSVEFEEEADYVGMYYMERAGYDSDGVADFWRRMAIEHPASIEHRQSHPTTPERFLAIEKTAAEIDTKRAAGAALLPNYKGD